MPPALPILRADLDLSLVTGGWVASILNLVSATLGIACGLLADRVGARKIVAGGVLMLAIGAFVGGFAGNGFTLLVARAIAGVGLVSVAVAGPRIIVAASRPRDFGLTLGIWSIYMPTGMALAMFSAPYLMTWLGWRGLWFFNAAALTLFLGWFVNVTSRKRWEGVPRPKHQRTWREVLEVFRLPGPWLLGVIFGCYALQWFAMMTWLPTFLIETQGHTAASAAWIAALVVTANIGGCLGGAWLLHHHAPRWLLQVIALSVMGLCAIGVFGNGLPPGLKPALAFVFSAAGGLLPAATLAASTVHAPTHDQVSTVSGFIVQGSNTGGLAGPPVMAAIVAHFGGWAGSEWLLVGSAVLGVVLAIGVRHIEIHRAQPPPP